MDCVPATQLPPGDPRLVEAIVGQLKSKGIFDQFRKECLADVDTKPAFQNLRQRVEGQVNKFLEKKTWKNDMNKNQLRDGVRKHVNSLGILDSGIDAIITQVVNPKIKPLILPYVEDTVYAFLQIDKPKRERKMSEPPVHPMPQMKEEEQVEEEVMKKEEENKREVKEEEKKPEPKLEMKEEEEKPKPKHVEPVEEKKPAMLPLPMETDVISSEEDDILARESPEASSKSSSSPDVDDVKTLDEDAQDGFDGCSPVKEDSPEGIAADVERLQLSEDESKSAQAPKQSLPLFEDQSLDSISSNSSGLTFSPLTVKGSPESKKDDEIRSDGSPGAEMRSTTSTPLVDEKPVDDSSQSSLGSDHSNKDFPSSGKMYHRDGTMQGQETSTSSLAALQSGARHGKDGTTSLMSFDEESMESKASSKVSVVSGKSEMKGKSKVEKSEGEITSSSDSSDGDIKIKQEHLPSEGRHSSDHESSHKSSKSRSDHKRRDSHSRDSHSRDRDREKDKDRDSRHQKDKEKKHSKSRDDHHSHRDKDRKHHRRDKDHDGDRERSRSHHHPSSGSSYKESSSSKDKDRSSHHSGGKSSEGKSRSSHSTEKSDSKTETTSEEKSRNSHSNEKSDGKNNSMSKGKSKSSQSNEKSEGKTEAKSSDKSHVKSSKSSERKEKHSEEKSDKKSDKKREQHSDEKHSKKAEHKLEKNSKSYRASKKLKLDQEDKKIPEILSVNSSSDTCDQKNGVLGMLGENTDIDMLGLNGDIIVQDGEGNFMMLTYEDDTDDSMSSSISQVGGSGNEASSLKTQFTPIRKETINDFEGFENADSDPRLHHYIRNIVRIPDEMDMEYSEWFDESDMHMTLYDEAWKEKVPLDEFLKCMHRLGAVIRNEKGAIEDHSTRELISFEGDIKDNNNIQPVGKKRRISNSSSVSSSGSSSGSPKHKRCRRGRSALNDTSQMLDQDSVIVRGYALLTPEDDGNRSMSREYDIDYSQKIANYSPLSPASDSSADEAKTKLKDHRRTWAGTVMNSRDNLVKPSVKMDQKNGRIVAHQRS